MSDNEASLTYRTMQPLAKPKKQVYGLVRFPRHKIHKCHPPNQLVRFLYWLTFRPIHNGDYWRCRCGRVYTRDTNYDLQYAWTITNITQKEWEELSQ